MSQTSIGLGLFKYLVAHNLPFSTLADHELGEEYFDMEENELLTFNFLRQFVLDYGVNPEISTIARHLGRIDIFDSFPDEPMEYWINGIRTRKRYQDLQQTLREVNTELEAHRLEAALDRMGAGYLHLRESFTDRRLTNLREAQREVLDKHDEVQTSPDLPGIPFGFPYLDSVSGGAQDGDYVIIVGQTGVGKSFLALKCSRSAWLDGKSVIYLSTEMSNLQTARRVLAMEGRFSTEDLKKGRLSYYGRQRAEEILEQGIALDGAQDNFFHLLPGGMFPKVEDFAVVIKELKPDFAVVDGAYLLQASSKSWWEKNMEVAMILKNLALNENIPVLATYQYLKKDVGRLEGVGGGFAIPHIASMVLSFEYERKEDIGNIQDVQFRVLRLTKGRDGESGSIRVRYNMRTTQLVQEARIFGHAAEEEEIEHNLAGEMDDSAYNEI